MSCADSSTRARHRLHRVMQHMSPTPAHASPSSVASPTSSSSPAPFPSSASTSAVSISDQLQLRRLQRSDFRKGFLGLLAELTDVGDVSEERFSARFDELARAEDAQQVWVIEDTARATVVASATLLLELKFIHNISKIAHIEDVVVNGEYRGKNLGYKLIDHLLSVARALGCYKVILDCDDKNVAFYAKLGFRKHANHLANYFQPLGGGARKESG